MIIKRTRVKGKGVALRFSYEPGNQPAMRVFRASEGLGALPPLAIGEAIFRLEKELRVRRVDSLVIEIPGTGCSTPALRRIGSALRRLINYVLIEDVEIVLEASPPPPPRRIRTPFELGPSDAVCLFSGGLDSLVGISMAARQSRRTNALFCAHSDQSHVIRIVEQLRTTLLEPIGIQMRTTYASRVGKGGYAQTRGLLYSLAGVAWMNLLGASELVISEVGPTMYQPKFALFDSITYTTHPIVIATAREVAEELLQRPIGISMPFEDSTKAELFALAQADLPLGKTHSCVTQRFGDHDGTCYGCTIRRLGAIAADRKDVPYKRNPLVDANASRGNVMALLRFCRDFLWDVSQMEEYEVGDILLYGKQDLFRRFALDNFAALHRLSLGGVRLAGDVKTVYGQALEVLGGKVELDRRLEELSPRQ